jgi:hypothetical protein
MGGRLDASWRWLGYRGFPVGTITHPLRLNIWRRWRWVGNDTACHRAACMHSGFKIFLSKLVKTPLKYSLSYSRHKLFIIISGYMARHLRRIWNSCKQRSGSWKWRQQVPPKRHTHLQCCTVSQPRSSKYLPSSSLRPQPQSENVLKFKRTRSVEFVLK